MNLGRLLIVHKQVGNILISCKVCTHEINIQSLDDQDLDYIKCSGCDQYFHGECLSINDSILPHLHIFREVGGWCCTYCHRNPISFNTKPLDNTTVKKSTTVDKIADILPPVNYSIQDKVGVGSSDRPGVDVLLDVCSNLASEISDLKVQIRVLTG